MDNKRRDIDSRFRGNDSGWGQDTMCVHSGTYYDEKTRGVNTPIFTSTSFGYIDMEQHSYPRYFNIPNQKAVAKKIAALEGGEAGLVFSSGMAAISTALYALLRSGDHAIFQKGLYGGTHKFILNQMEKFGIEYSFARSTSAEDFKREVKPNTKIIYIESPSNPLLDIVSLAGIAAIGKELKLTTLIDNTFASPINQNPIKHGIDVVLHSGTKYLGGHTDICCGAVVASNEIMDNIYNSAIVYGGDLNPEACYLLERSLKTLSLRVKQQNKNALSIAKYLSTKSQIQNVYYPALLHHPNHKVASEQMSGFGGIVSFTLDGDGYDVHRFLNKLRIIKPSMSLGGVESIICSPAETSHASMARQEKEELGIGDNLLRLSVGIEDVDDLTEDIEMAFTN